MQEKEDRINLRIREDHKAMLVEAADLAGESLSSFLVRVGVSAARRMLKEAQ